MDVEKRVNDIISSNDDVWKDLDYYKSKVQKEYISELKQTHPDKNAQQSWRSVSGQFLELFVRQYISSRTDKNVKREPNVRKEIKDTVRIDFGGVSKLPDLDIVVYDDRENVECIISCKTSIRERVSQTLFWKKMIEEQIDTSFYFVTTDSDNELSKGRKWRPIIEDVMSGTFVLEDSDDKMSEHIRPFDEIVSVI